MDVYPVEKLQLLKAAIVLTYASNVQRKLSMFFLFISADSLVTLCLFTIVLLPYCDCY